MERKMNTIEYMNYHAHISFDSEIEMFMGRVLNAGDIITFYGKSVEELNREFKASIDDYLLFCKEKGIKPTKPYSGKFNVRVDPDLHAQLSLAAAKRGVSLNNFIVSVLEKETMEELCA